MNLRQLVVHNSSWHLQQTITERFGSNLYLFNYSFNPPARCDGDVIYEFLCYKDNAYGLEKFSDKACSYSSLDFVGLREMKHLLGINAYPNPVIDELTLGLENYSDHSFLLVDIPGKEILRHEILESKTQIDFRQLNKGIYFLQYFEKEKLIGIQKIVKE